MWFWPIPLLFLLIGCQMPAEKSTDDNPPIDPYSITQYVHFSKNSDESLMGQGRIVFNHNLFGAFEAYLFHLNFLYIQPTSGTLEVLLFASHPQLSDGLRIQFEQKDRNLNVTLSCSGQRPIDISSFFTAKDSRFPYQFKIGVSHDKQGTRLRIWSSHLSTLTPNNAFFDSRHENILLNPKSRGTFWGIHLHQVKLNSARAVPLYVP